MKHYVTVSITGRVTVVVDADDFSVAEDRANDVISEMDFGPLENIDWETAYIENENGRTKVG